MRKPEECLIFCGFRWLRGLPLALLVRAYSSRANRDWLRAHRIRATIPVKADQAANRRRRGGAGGRPPAFDPDVHEDRNAVERGFSRLRHNHGPATRYDKLAIRYWTTTRITAIDHWLKQLT